ncbi:MAG: RelA/SpoT family protein [Bacteroidia bacterium]|nr:RelA/SpoT family protein [Bacteroidia bacterium]
MIKYQPRDLDRITKNVSTLIEDEISRAGLIFRIFSRVKTDQSLNTKIISKGKNYYDGETKLIRDAIGIRVILYFSDDVPIVYNRLKGFFPFVEETIDKNEATKFAPTKLNLVFKLPTTFNKEFKEIIKSKMVDDTFEIQLRTVLSEGWHEVDHDLRYKCKKDWQDHSELERSFNGILASLETSEYAILRLFEQLSFRHYKAKEFIPMVRTKFRIRISDYDISEKLEILLTEDFIRDFFKVDRIELLTKIFESNFLLPLSLNNFIFLVNYIFIKEKEILSITPSELIDSLG